MTHTLLECKNTHCKCMDKNCTNYHFADCETNTRKEVRVIQQPADHVRFIEKDGEQAWQIKSKEYGWETVQKFQAIMALHNCTEVHNWKDLGDPCLLCGSDNCAICLGCGINTHD